MEKRHHIKDPGSAITHGIALLLAAVGAVPLIIKAARSYDVLHIVALSIFILTMVLLYAASTIYHSVDGSHDDFCDDRRKLYSCMPDRSS